MATKRRRSDGGGAGGAGAAPAKKGHSFDPEAFKESREYMSGFGGSFESEAVKGALPKGQNNPQVGGAVFCRAVSAPLRRPAAAREAGPAGVAVSLTDIIVFPGRVVGASSGMRSWRRSACTRSSCRAPPSPCRAPATSARGCTASSRA